MDENWVHHQFRNPPHLHIIPLGHPSITPFPKPRSHVHPVRQRAKLLGDGFPGATSAWAPAESGVVEHIEIPQEILQNVYVFARLLNKDSRKLSLVGVCYSIFFGGFHQDSTKS